MQNMRYVGVRREAYHKVVLHFIVTNEKICIKRVTPDVGPLPDVTPLLNNSYDSLADARAAVREAMKARDVQDPSCVKITPDDWVQCVLKLDDWLVDLGLGFDDYDDAKNKLKLEIRRSFKDPEKRVDTLVATCVVKDNVFVYPFGQINWNTFTAN